MRGVIRWQRRQQGPCQYEEWLGRARGGAIACQEGVGCTTTGVVGVTGMAGRDRLRAVVGVGVGRVPRQEWPDRIRGMQHLMTL